MGAARYIAIEGPLRVGKSSLARALADRIRARTLLEQLGLDGAEDPTRLSGGEARRCAIARALAPAPDILLLDEPTNHLDLPAIEWLEATLAGLPSALVLISPNDPVAMVNYAKECQELGVPFAYDPSQQLARLSEDDLKASVPGAKFLFCNEYELAVIQNKTGWGKDEIQTMVETLVVTYGKKGSIIYTDGQEYAIPVAPLDKIDDPTGAGDAFRGGFFAAWQAGLPWDVVGRVGALCSTYALENIGTTTHRFSPAEFAARYAAYFGEQPALAKLGQGALA